MRILNNKNILLSAFFTISCSFLSQGQTINDSDTETTKNDFPFYQKTVIEPSQATVTIHEDEKIKRLLKLKNKMSIKGAFNDRYKIQLDYGSIKEANEILKQYNEAYEEWKGTIVYQTPNYKIWVGNFRNQLEADRALMKIKEKFPDAFILKPKVK